MSNDRQERQLRQPQEPLAQSNQAALPREHREEARLRPDDGEVCEDEGSDIVLEDLGEEAARGLMAFYQGFSR